MWTSGKNVFVLRQWPCNRCVADLDGSWTEGGHLGTQAMAPWRFCSGVTRAMAKLSSLCACLQGHLEGVCFLLQGTFSFRRNVSASQWGFPVPSSPSSFSFFNFYCSLFERQRGRGTGTGRKEEREGSEILDLLVHFPNAYSRS